MESSDREPLLARARGEPAPKTRAVAVAISIALHSAVAVTALQIHWSADDDRRAAQPNVVWLGAFEIEAAARTAVPAPMLPESTQPEQGEPPQPPAQVEPQQRPQEQESAPQPEPRQQTPSAANQEAEPAPAGDDPPADERAPDPGSGRSRAYIVREVDWEAERRRAVASVREQSRREAGYLTFSLDDVIEKPLPEEPGLAENIFDTPKRSGPSVLRPGRSGTRLGRFVSTLCDITGGISLFGVASACAESEVPNDLFASIKPEYLKKRPEELRVRSAMDSPQSLARADAALPAPEGPALRDHAGAADMPNTATANAENAAAIADVPDDPGVVDDPDVVDDADFPDAVDIRNGTGADTANVTAAEIITR